MGVGQPAGSDMDMQQQQGENDRKRRLSETERSAGDHMRDGVGPPHRNR